MSLDLSTYGPATNEKRYVGAENANILADFDIGNQYGQITHVDFVFTHRHALLLFEMNTHASIMSLTKPQRDDVLGPKYPDSRSFAQSPQSRYFALLTRSKGQDQVSVFAPSDRAFDKAVTFNPRTFDAQGLLWCPNGTPILIVWDSPAYGLKVSFFSALGHHLQQLDLTAPEMDPNLGPLGTHELHWIYRSGRTFLVIAAGKRAVMVYEQVSQATVSSQSPRILLSTASRTFIVGSPSPPSRCRQALSSGPDVCSKIKRLTVFQTPLLLAKYLISDYVDAAAYPIWQETPQRTFSAPTMSFEATPGSDAEAGIDIMQLNADCTLLAVKDDARPKLVWIWRVPGTEPIAVLTFHENVRHLLWHPTEPATLVVITARKESVFYAWTNLAKPPVVGMVPLPTSLKTTGRYEGAWLPNDVGGRNLFMLSSPEAFDVGFVEEREGALLFDSVLQRDSITDEDSLDVDNTAIVIPSKSST